MTVCIATNIYYPTCGGIPNYYKNLAGNLISQGHSVIILTVDHAEINQPDQLIREGDNFIKIVLNTSYRTYKNYYRQFFRPGEYAAYEWIATGLAMKEWLHQNHSSFKIDIIETTDYGGTGIFLVDDKLPPLIVIGHSSITQLSQYNYTKIGDHSKVLKKLERLSFEFCNAIFAHSPLNQESLNKLTGKKIYFARAPWIFPEILPSNVKSTGKNLIVSSLQMTKGAKIMAAVTRKIVQQFPAWKLHWIGGDTHTAPGNKKISAFLNKNYSDIWNKNFVWQDEKNHREVLEEIAASSVVIIPSVWDTFNYCALEAAFLQKPLIITEDTGSSYLFKDDPNVITISSNPVTKIAELLENETALENWKNSINLITKEYLTSYFSAEAIITERISLYKEIITGRKKHGRAPQESLQFLEKYTTPIRKFYFICRKLAKLLIKGNP